MTTIKGWTHHGRVTLSSKRKQLRTKRKTLEVFKALANPTPKQLNQILILQAEIPRLEQSIRAWQ